MRVCLYRRRAVDSFVGLGGAFRMPCFVLGGARAVIDGWIIGGR